MKPIELVSEHPATIATRVWIQHPQLRDLLQPAGNSKENRGKVLFVNRFKIECADFDACPEGDEDGDHNDWQALIASSESAENSDIVPRKSPVSTFCTLDFLPVCLTTAEGLVAAGGQQSEMDIRPLLPLPSIVNAAVANTARADAAATEANVENATALAADDGAIDASGWYSEAEPGRIATAATSLPSSSRALPRWHLQKPTGGSINNSICIYPDLAMTSPSSIAMTTDVAQPGSLSSGSLHKRARGETTGPERRDEAETQLWQRDDPLGRVEGEDTGLRSELDTSMEVDGMHCLCFPDNRDHAIEGADIGGVLGAPGKKRVEDGKRCIGALTTPPAFHGAGPSVGALGPFRSSTLTCSSEEERARSTVRVLVSNNDQSVKAFKLQPPVGMGSGTSSSGFIFENRESRPFHSPPAPSRASLAGSQLLPTVPTNANNGLGERIEKSLPVISKTKTINFPTCINHSSFSPDGKHLVCVGDTPDVFLFRVDWPGGDLVEIATYTASSDASFSTSWSPDGLQFAVASQDGIVSVWDVRSSQRIATLQTSQATGHISGAGAARVVKWSPRGDMLAFTEHQNYFHVVETTTFQAGQKIHVPLGTGGDSSSSNRSSHHFSYSSSNPSSSVRRGVLPMQQSRSRSTAGNSIGDFVDLFGSLPRYSSNLRNSSTTSARHGPRSESNLLVTDASDRGEDGRDGQNTRRGPGERDYEPMTSTSETATLATHFMRETEADTRGRRALASLPRVSPLTRHQNPSASDREADRHASTWLMAEARLLAAARAGHSDGDDADGSRSASTMSLGSDSERTSQSASQSTAQTSVATGRSPQPSGNQEPTPAFLARSVESIMHSLGSSHRGERDNPSSASAAASVRRAVMAANEWPPPSSIINLWRDREALHQRLSSSSSSSSSSVATGSVPLAASNDVDISGLAWDPCGEYLYVSTDCLVARYDVLDLRRSFGSADLL